MPDQEQRIIHLQLQKFGSIRNFSGGKGYSPLDQFYGESFNMTKLRVLDVSIFIDSSKLYINPYDGAVLYRQMSKWLKKRMVDEDDRCEMLSNLWDQVGPVYADFIPKGHLGMEEGYLLMKQPPQTWLPPLSFRH